jgi:hypothetical protein
MKISYQSALINLFLAISALFCSGSIFAAEPLWTFTPLTETTISLPSNSSATVQYQVTNQSVKPHTLKMKPLQGITQNTSPGFCGTTFTLPGKNSSCTLSLLVNGSKIPSNIDAGPVVCQAGNQIECYQPSQANSLHIAQAGPITVATLSVAGSPLHLILTEGNGTLTVTNTSLVLTALNIASNFAGTALQGNVTETGNTCQAVVPGASCTLTFTPGNTVVAQTNFPIAGTNTTTLTAAIVITGPLPTITGLSPNSGNTLGNTPVTITGTHLTGTTTVTFGGSAASNVTVVNDTTVTLNTPPNIAGSVNVVLTTNFGSVTDPNSYTYISSPTLNSVFPTTGATSGGTGVTLSGTNLSGVTSVTFGGVAATSVNGVNSTTVTAVTPAGAAGAVDVILTTATGSSTLTAGYTYVTTFVGQSTSGGVVACLGGGTQNLIAATADNSAGIVWGPAGLVGASSTTDGATNTATIVASIGTGTTNAAPLCAQYQVDSQGNSPCVTGNTCYQDWFLPAQTQLTCLDTNQLAIGGFTTGSYWSSTEVDSTDAMAEDFLAHNQVTLAKTSSQPIRCTRTFTP